MVKVNGEELAVAGLSVSELLERLGYAGGRVAVELNGDIVRRADYGATVLRDGDVVEVVRFVGGG
ncbi:MAG: sulfur carrier protein ThiS [Oligosphaeraceae bacterium]